MSSSNALDGVFTVAGVRPARDGMTISRDTKLGKENVITFFEHLSVRSVTIRLLFTSELRVMHHLLQVRMQPDRVLLMVICLLYQVEHFVVLIANLERYIQK